MKKIKNTFAPDSDMKYFTVKDSSHCERDVSIFGGVIGALFEYIRTSKTGIKIRGINRYLFKHD